MRMLRVYVFVLRNSYYIKIDAVFSVWCWVICKFAVSTTIIVQALLQMIENWELFSTNLNLLRHTRLRD